MHPGSQVVEMRGGAGRSGEERGGAGRSGEERGASSASRLADHRGWPSGGGGGGVEGCRGGEGRGGGGGEDGGDGGVRRVRLHRLGGADGGRVERLERLGVHLRLGFGVLSGLGSSLASSPLASAPLSRPSQALTSRVWPVSGPLAGVCEGGGGGAKDAGQPCGGVRRGGGSCGGGHASAMAPSPCGWLASGPAPMRRCGEGSGRVPIVPGLLYVSRRRRRCCSGG